MATMTVTDARKLKKLSKERDVLIKKIMVLNKEYTKLLKKKIHLTSLKKKDHPIPGSVPEKLCSAMSEKPMKADEIAKKTGLKIGTVKIYLNKYDCFESTGYGQGYAYVGKIPSPVKKTNKKAAKK